MRAQVQKLPGVNCTFYWKGYCLYGEHINPGDNPEWMCSEVTRVMRAFDEFAIRVEKFSLDDAHARQSWDTVESDLPTAGMLCKSYCADVDELGGENRVTDCSYEQNLVCMLKLPACTGVCRRYRHIQASKKTNESLF